MTKMQRLMASAVGFDVEIHLFGGFKPFVGKCTDYIQPLDNDPEEASIYISVPGRSCLYEITEEEIETLVIKKEKM